MRRAPSMLRGRATATAVLLLVGAYACSGIITGPDDGPDTSPRSIRVAPSRLDLALGDTGSVRAVLYDVTGAEAQPAAGQGIRYVSLDSTIARVDSVSGLVTGVAAGNTSVRSAYGALGLAIPVAVLASPRLERVSGDAQVAEQGDTLPARLVVRARDATGQPDSGVVLQWRVTLGGGAMDFTDTTGADGRARARWRLGLALGAQAVEVTAAGYDTVGFTANATAGTRPARVRATSARDTLVGVGDTTRVTAAVFNVADAPLPGAAQAFTSLAPGVATVDPAGLVTAVDTGAAWIRATSGEASDSTRITVRPAPITTKLDLGVDVRHPARLQHPFEVRLAVAPETDIPVIVTSSDFDGLRISRRESGFGGQADTLLFEAGSDVATFWVRGVPGATGRTVTLVASAPGVLPDTLIVTVVNPEFVLSRAGAQSVPAVGGADPILVLTVGAARTLGGAFEPMAVSVGFPAEPFTLTSTTPSTALMRFVASDATTGVDQGPSASVSFGMIAGRNATPMGIFLGEVASLQLARTGVAGAASVTASAGTAEWIARTATVDYTLTGSGVTPRVRTWTGATSSAWTEPTNWLEGLVPAEEDSVFIPTTGVTAMPVIPPTQIRALVSANAGTLTLDGDGSVFVADALVLRNDVLAANCGIGGGFSLTNPTTDGPHALGGRIACGVNIQYGDRVLVDSLVLVGKSLGMSGDSRLTLAGHPLRMDGEQLFVSGNARLEMLQPTDRVHALFANLSARGQGSMFTAGTLHVRQGVGVSTGPGGFVTGAAHRLVLDPMGTTDVATLLTTTGVRFGSVELRGPTLLDGTFVAAGDFTMTSTASLADVASASFGLPQRLRVEGDFTAAAGATTTVRLLELGGTLTAATFAPDTLVLVGTGQTLPLDGTVDGLRSVRVSGTAVARVQPSTRRFIAGDLIIDGDLTIADAAATIAIGVSGDLRVIGNGILRLGGQYASVRVEGDALFDGREMNGELASGDIELRGDLVQRATTSPRSLRPAAGFTITLIGSGAIDFATPGQSVLGVVQHWGNLTRTLRSDVTALGEVRYDLNNVTVASATLGAGGTRTITAAGLDMGGSVTVQNVAYRILDGAPIDLTGGPVFRDFDPAAVQLELVRSSGNVSMGFARFETVPTGAGRYLRLSDPTGAGDGAFTLTASNTFPATHGGFAEAIAPAQLNGWPAGVVALPKLGAGADLAHPVALQRPVAGTLPAALAGELRLSVKSLDVDVALVSVENEQSGRDSIEVVLAAGASGFTWWLHGIEGQLGRTARVVVEAAGYESDTVVVTLTRAAARLTAVGATTLPSTGGTDPQFIVTVGWDSAGTFFPLALRRGGPGRDFTITSALPAAALLRFNPSDRTTGAAQGPAASVTFTLNGFYSATQEANPAFAVLASLELSRPGGSGTALLSLTPPDEFDLVGAPVSVTITPPLAPIALGGDWSVPLMLMRRMEATLPTPTAAPTVVTLRARSAAVVGVSADSLTVGGATAELSLPAGTTTFSWWAHGVGLTLGDTSSIIAEASGYAPDTVIFELDVPSATLSVIGANVIPVTGGVEPQLQVIVGEWDGEDLWPLPVRAGGDPVPMMIESGNSIVLRTTLSDNPSTSGGPAGPSGDLEFALNPGFSSTQLEDVGLGRVAALRVSRRGVVGSSIFSLFLPGDWRFRGATPIVTVEPAPGALSITMLQGNIIGLGATAIARVTLSAPAPAGGVTLALDRSGTGNVSIEPSFEFLPAGTTSFDFFLEGLSLGTVTLTATAEDYATATLVITVTNQIISLPSTLNVPYGLTTSIPVQLATPAPPGGLTVTLSTTDATRVGVTTSSVVVPAGATLASGTLSGVLPGSATITATAAGWVSDQTVATTTAVLNIIETGLSLNTSFGTTMTVELRSGATAISAPAPGLTFSLTALDATCVSVPATATITTGSTQVVVPVTYGGSAPAPCASRVRVTGANLQPDSLQANVAAAPSISVGNITTGGGLQVTSNATLSVNNYGAVTARVTSLDPSRLLIAPDRFTVGTAFVDVPLAQPSTNVSFVLAGVEGATGVVPVEVAAPGFRPDTALVTLRGLGIEFLSLLSSTTSLTPNALFQVRIGFLNPGGTSIEGEHELRTGGTPITVTVSNSNAAVAQLVTGTGPAQSVTSTIPLLQTRTPSGATNGGLEFDPLAPGSTTVTVTAPGLVATAGATREITIVAPALSVSNATIGAGMQTGAGGNLGASDYGSATVRVESLDPALVVVAPNGSTVGTTFIEFPLTAPTTGFNYTIAALEGTTGVGRVVVTATGFLPDTSFITVRGLGVELLSVPASTTSLTTNAPFQARLGYLNPAGTTIEGELALRTGGVPITVTVTNSNAAAAQLVTTALTGQSVTATIAVGNTRTPFGAASGGIEFDPTGPGLTTVSVTAPGLVATPTASANVTITAPVLTVSNQTTGAGLQLGGGGTLGASSYGTSNMRVESLDPAIVRVAPNANTVADTFIEFVLTAPTTGFSYTVAGVEGASGVGRIVVTATGFTPDTSFVTVRPLGVELLSLPASTTSLTANTAFQARVGYLNPGGTTIEGEHQIRTGGTPITVSVSNSAPTVAQLVTTALTGQGVSATIPVGGTRTPAALAAGGMEFDPLSTGTTTVSVTSPGLTSTPTASQQVTVIAPAITAGDVILGSGLQSGSGGTLGASNYGTTTVRVESSDPALVVVAPNANTAGSAFIEIPMTAPSTGFSYTIAALEGVTGTATITVSAPGFTSVISTITVRGLGVELLSAPSSIIATAANANFQARIGLLNVGGTAIESELAIRAGGTPITVTVTNSNAAVARLVTSGGPTQSASATIAVGNTRTPFSAASGGIEFDPLAAGSTTLSASAPGLVATAGATRIVSVTLPTITYADVAIGAGLVVTHSGTLNNFPTGESVSATISVSDTSLILVNDGLSRSFGTSGSGLSYQLSAREGVTGTATVTVQASGYETRTFTVTVRPMAITLGSVPSTLSMGSGPVVQAFIGTPNAAGTAIEYFALTRPGAPPLVVTFATSDATRLSYRDNGTPTDSPTATILANTSSATSTSIALAPVAPGTATISVSAPNALSLPGASRAVTVTP